MHAWDECMGWASERKRMNGHPKHNNMGMVIEDGKGKWISGETKRDRGHGLMEPRVGCSNKKGNVMGMK